MNALKSLYNGIMNDSSIRRYSLGWQNIVNKIEAKYKDIPKTNEQFEDKLILNALSVAKGSLRRDIECFSKELSINVETLRNNLNQ